MKELSTASPGVSRRDFLARMTAAAAAGMVIPPTAAVASSSPASRASDASDNRKICFFSKDLQWLDYDALAGTLAEAGVDGIDFTVRPGGHVLPERVTEDLPRAVEAARKAGLSVPMITTAITDANHPATEPILKTASDLGIRYYRMGYLNYDMDQGVGGNLVSYVPRLRELQALNQQYGVHGAYQNHSGPRVGGPIWDLWLLLRELNPEWIGVQYDIRHATVEGANSWPLALDLVKDHIRTIVTKDFHWLHDGDRWRIHNVPLGQGMVDFKRYFDLIRQYGVTGPISLHVEYHIIEKTEESLPFEARRQKAVVVLRRDAQWLRDMLGETGLL